MPYIIVLLPRRVHGSRLKLRLLQRNPPPGRVLQQNTQNRFLSTPMENCNYDTNFETKFRKIIDSIALTSIIGKTLEEIMYHRPIYNYDTSNPTIDFARIT